MEKIKLESIKNKSPFTHILSDDIKYKVLPHLELVPNNQVKDTYEELIGSNNALYIMSIIFLIIFEVALFFTINKLELVIASIIAIILLIFITIKLIKSIQTINSIEIRYSTLSIAEIKDTKSNNYIKLEDKTNNYLIDGWIEIDKKHNIGDEIVLFITYNDKYISISCKERENTINNKLQEQQNIEVTEENQVTEEQETKEVLQDTPKIQEEKVEEEEII